MSKTEDEVHLVQKLLTVDEVFIYRIPPLKSSGGHRAEDWDLAKPLQTCKLVVERLDNTCLVKFFAEKINANGIGSSVTLFAQSNITVSETQKLEYYLESVVDSSRYFAVKIEDLKTSRTAHIGVGFRERDDASNFRMALQDYERSMQREIQAEAMHHKYEEEEQVGDKVIDAVPQVLSKLTLKEGEKIYLNIKGHEKSENSKKKITVSSSGGPVPLLKKPPPPASAVLDTPYADCVVSLKELEKDNLKSSSSSSEVGSECAVASEVDTIRDVEDDDEDDWTEFESSTSSSN
mmetsp:Transcript_15799/g.23252  ORF Transcript_15799/g.23252 Transcript_15799/m.23252 type:complete len:292 (-) Transcript_15799:68-943(-)